MRRLWRLRPITTSRYLFVPESKALLVGHLEWVIAIHRCFIWAEAESSSEAANEANTARDGVLQGGILVGRQMPRKFVARMEHDIEKLKIEVDQVAQQDGDGIHHPASVYATLLRSCADANALPLGKRIHALLIRRSLDQDMFIGNHLVNMYSKCRSIEDAFRVFFEMPQRNVISWNIMVAAYALNGQPRKALQLFRRMESEGVKPSEVTFITVVGACSNVGILAEGRAIHSRISAEIAELSVVLGTSLITMYGKCGGLEEARQVFDKMTTKNDVSWNAMIGAYAQQGYGQHALELFHRMKFQPNEVTFVSALDACASVGDLAQGKQIHSRIASRFSSSDILNTALVNMYAKCGSLTDARSVFDRMPRQDVVSWTAMIAAYAQHGYGLDALEVYWRMDQEGVKPDKVVFVSVLDACTSLGDLEQGRRVHARVCASAFESDSSIANTLVNMYRKCGDLSDARGIFSRMQWEDEVSWNAMIAGYAEQGNGQEALQVFRRMDLEGVKPDVVTFNSIPGAFSSPAFLAEGRAIHARSLACGIDLEAVGTSLVKMYGQCRSLEDARAVFDKMCNRDVVSWSAMIGAYAQRGHGVEALELYQKMEPEGVQPNDITFISLLDACASAGDLSQGKQIHSRVIAAGFESEIVVGTALVNMYGKCGDVLEARSVFDKMEPRDVISFTAMISSYVQHGHYQEALELYFRLEPAGMKPDKVTYVSVLEACANLTALQQGKAVHASIAASGLDSDMSLGNSLINLYAKCGSLHGARRVFEGMRCRDVVSWNTIIAAYAHHGHEDTALQLFLQMKVDGIDPNDVTFVSVLFVCSHAGLLHEGSCFFASITGDYGLTLTPDHYGCVIDLLGRAGNLDEAEKLISKISEPCPVVWMTLLAACRTHGDVDRALCAAERVAELDPKTSAPNVLLSNIYAAAGRWREAAELRNG